MNLARQKKIAALIMIALLALSAATFAQAGKLPRAVLWKNVARCNVETVEKVLGENVFAPDDLGKALWMAVTRYSPDNRRKTLRIVEMLILKGADVNFTDTYERTSLMLASANLHSELVKLLLANGADPTLADTKGRVASDYAASAARSANNVMKLLDK